MGDTADANPVEEPERDFVGDDFVADDVEGADDGTVFVVDEDDEEEEEEDPEVDKGIFVWFCLGLRLWVLRL